VVGRNLENHEAPMVVAVVRNVKGILEVVMGIIEE
jgi:hypothetical protein